MSMENYIHTHSSHDNNHTTSSWVLTFCCRTLAEGWGGDGSSTSVAQDASLGFCVWICTMMESFSLF